MRRRAQRRDRLEGELRLAGTSGGGRDGGWADRQPLRDVHGDQRNREHGRAPPLPRACAPRSRCVLPAVALVHGCDDRGRPVRLVHARRQLVIGRSCWRPRAGGTVASSPPPMHILITEDEPLLARFIARGLHAAGYDTSIAGDGADALEQIAAHDWDLVVLDLLLPGLDGFDVLAAVAAQPRPPRVLVLSARQEVETRIAALDGGASDFLAKPFSFDELLARVRAQTREGPVRTRPHAPMPLPAARRRDARGRARRRSPRRVVCSRVRRARVSAADARCGRLARAAAQRDLEVPVRSPLERGRRLRRAPTAQARRHSRDRRRARRRLPRPPSSGRPAGWRWRRSSRRRECC